MSRHHLSGTVIVAGVPGVEKGEALARVEQSGWSLINFGNLMLRMSEKSREEMRHMPQDELKWLQRKTWVEIERLSKRDLIVVDTHVAIRRTNGTYMKGVPDDIPGAIGLRGVVLLEAKPEEIIERSENDPRRDRGTRTAHEVQEHLERSRQLASLLRVGHRVPLCKISVLHVVGADLRGKRESELIQSFLISLGC